eukprot:GGOE01025725.1.p5 GENE.GGOE01025725.1~~GGOE01025725.1.p5  ORF type:complete len:100 (-),score=5.62 GGOE01025725.1:285-584(-)
MAPFAPLSGEVHTLQPSSPFPPFPLASRQSLPDVPASCPSTQSARFPVQLPPYICLGKQLHSTGTGGAAFPSVSFGGNAGGPPIGCFTVLWCDVRIRPL